MKKLLYGMIGYMSIIAMIMACNKDDQAQVDPDPDCSSTAPTISVSTTGTECGTTNGSLAITANGSNGPLQYSINGTDFQASNTFASLKPGKYTVAVKDANNCTTTAEAQISSGISFDASIKEIITTNCAISGCHVQGGTGPGDFTQLAQLQARASAIKTRTGNKSMPVGRTLSDAQIQQIACWVDDGAPEN